MSKTELEKITGKDYWQNLNIIAISIFVQTDSYIPDMDVQYVDTLRIK